MRLRARVGWSQRGHHFWNAFFSAGSMPATQPMKGHGVLEVLGGFPWCLRSALLPAIPGAELAG